MNPASFFAEIPYLCRPKFGLNMLAVVKIAGQQFKVKAGDSLYVPHIEGKAGDAVEFSDVLLTQNDGNVLSANFGANPLTGTENSETVIYRTSATTYGLGTFGVIDGSTLQGLTYAPAVPEPATWAMMLVGFGGIGLAMRRRRKPALAQLA